MVYYLHRDQRIASSLQGHEPLELHPWCCWLWKQSALGASVCSATPCLWFWDTHSLVEHICIHPHSYSHVHTHSLTHKYSIIYIHTDTHAHTLVHTHMYTLRLSSHMYTNAHSCMYTLTHTCVHIDIMHTHTPPHSHTHIYTHTYAHVHTCSKKMAAIVYCCHEEKEWAGAVREVMVPSHFIFDKPRATTCVVEPWCLLMSGSLAPVKLTQRCSLVWRPSGASSLESYGWACIWAQIQ